ncbi:MAG: PilZ domain-containing protein [Candidatus Omnitrophica bacterium]|nr:PilZ domain-containing protein [Candidatus Omnitrophota bacterium]MBU1128747.1 PilZ domain-containing protein [Candidatus Omnitrophota bacterium]MBU1783997.1 PilZ domain-containing protein [Candidatus Omnitrophota bacterium]MBU1851774.1 PilZ domain-containing protein [Candidatus Omnitrophota bacterium]
MGKRIDRRKESRKDSAERRKFPRIEDKGIEVQLKGEGFGIITQSLDVSASGVYCKITNPIPLMTRLDIVLALPGKKAGSAPLLLHIEGVVVREHPVVKDGKTVHYDVAIFFNFLKPGDREKLITYINHQL